MRAYVGNAVHDSGKAPGLLTRALQGGIRLYQFLPRSGIPRCRFAPTCSAYAHEALATHGSIRGTWLAGRRIARCHPFNPGGVDRVPPRRQSTF